MSPDNNLFARLGILYLDHVAVTTPNLDLTLSHYLALPGARLLRGPADNPTQRVRYAFVSLPGSATIEVLAPLDDSPIAHHLSRGGGAYHLCYAVADLEHALEAATADGAKRIGEPTPDPAFDSRRVGFLHHRAHGLLELLEAYPDRAGLPSAANTTTDTAASAPSARLGDILRRLFPSLADEDVEIAAIDRTEGWDSASQLVLMMEVEGEFDIDIPTDRISEATDFRRLIALIEELGR